MECEQLLEHQLWSLDKVSVRRSHVFPSRNPLARYMDACIWEKGPEEFLIATVGSDTYLRVFNYHWKGDLQLVAAVAAGDHCLLKVLRMPLAVERSLLFTAGNDGRLRIWNLRSQPTLSDHLEQVTMLGLLHIHQSGINALDVLPIQDKLFLVLSGGDDNSLAMNHILIAEGTVTNLEEHITPDAHSAQITGVKIFGPHGEWVLSTGTDQRIRVWQRSAGTLRELCARTSSIPDIGSCACWRKSDGDLIVVVCGEGLDVSMYSSRAVQETVCNVGVHSIM